MRSTVLVAPVAVTLSLAASPALANTGDEILLLAVFCPGPFLVVVGVTIALLVGAVMAGPSALTYDFERHGYGIAPTADGKPAPRPVPRRGLGNLVLAVTMALAATSMWLAHAGWPLVTLLATIAVLGLTRHVLVSRPATAAPRGTTLGDGP